MNITLKKITSLIAAFVIALAAVITAMPAKASAATAIKYSIAYVGDKVQLTLTPQKSSDIIYYTTNGKKPTTGSTKYTGALQTGGKANIRAIEVNKKGKKVATLNVTIQARVQTPQITAKTSSGGLTLLKVTTATPGAKIYYTINGTKPTKSSYLYEDGNEPIYTEGTVFMFRAFKSGMKSSETVSYGDLPSFSEVSSGDVPAEAATILKLVNKERAAVGLGELKLDADLMKAADIRAKELAVKYDHVRPDGTSCFTVFDELGITQTTCGENIGMNQKTPEYVMERWMGSKNHKANILGESFTRIGIGHYNDNGVDYWVQLFLR